MGSKEVKNVQNQSPLLVEAFEKYLVSKPWVAERIYRDEWNDNEAIQKKLVVRLRNKLNGNGKVSLAEIRAIEDALLDFADGLKKLVNKSIDDRSKRFKKVVSEIIDSLSEEDKKDLLK